MIDLLTVGRMYTGWLFVRINSLFLETLELNNLVKLGKILRWNLVLFSQFQYLLGISFVFQSLLVNFGRKLHFSYVQCNKKFVFNY